MNPIAKIIGAPALTVRGRRSGLPITTPLSPFEYQGARYLVGGGGDTHWVRNLRAAGKGQLRMGRTHQEFRAVEIQGAERDRGMLAETAVVATAGLAVGLTVGYSLTYAVWSHSLVAPGAHFSPDLSSLALTIALVYAAVLLVTLLPARRAARLRPAEALRVPA